MEMKKFNVLIFIDFCNAILMTEFRGIIFDDYSSDNQFFSERFFFLMMKFIVNSCHIDSP